MAKIEVRGGRKQGSGLLQGKARGQTVVAHALVNDDIAEVVNRYSWSMCGKYVGGWDGSKVVYLHHFVYRALYGFTPDRGNDIDHIDGDKLNCLDSNLRRVPRSFNNANAGKQKNNTSGYKGVCWHKQRNRWLASVSQNNRSTYIGLFDTKEDAARAVNVAYRRLFPGVAVPNPSVE